VATQPAFEKFRPVELQVPPSRPKSIEGFQFEFELGRRMVQELGSFVKGFKDPITQISTPKSMEEVAAEVMKVDKTIELFQTMEIMNMNMEYGEFDFICKQFEEQIGYEGKGQGIVT
jgi:hypothetical protein